ncbi:MAG: BON domain-containing protein [Parvularculaceae bacterium]
MKEPPAASDSEITGRINDIFAEIDTLAGVEVQVDSGVVTLTGCPPQLRMRQTVRRQSPRASPG